MQEHEELFSTLCSYENLELAFRRARRGKTTKPYVIEFENNLKSNLSKLKNELLSGEYKPKPLETFIIRDPKTRKISKSDFRDRVVHHALCNVIEPIFDKTFIYDSYANRLGKGALKAVERFDCFKRKVSKNNTRKCFVLKADIRHYFETVDHKILISAIMNKIKDECIMNLIKSILENYLSKKHGKGMPLGNLTSQFFANVYLNELDQFVKHELKAKYYIRYVDDFVMLEASPELLKSYMIKINKFLNEKLDIELHPDKTKMTELNNGIGFLGFRIFFYHKLVNKKNIRNFERKFSRLRLLYKDGIIDRDEAFEHIQGWVAFVSHANTYKYRRNIESLFNECFT